MTVYFRVKTTESQKNRFSTASRKLSGKFTPRLPARSGQSDADIWPTSSTGRTKRTRTNTAVGAA